MNDDELLEALGELAREREEAFERQQSASGAPEAATVLSEASRASILDRARLSITPAAAAESNVIPLPRRRLWLAGAAALAAAAAVVFIVWPSPQALPELPGYRIALGEGEQAMRGGTADGAPVRLGPGSQLVVTLTPASSVPSRPVVHTFLGRDGDVRPWPVKPRVAEGGAVRIAGPVDELLPAEPGPYEIIALLTPSDAATQSREQLLAIAAGQAELPAGWRQVRATLELLQR